MRWLIIFRRNFFRRNKLDREWREEMEANIDLASDAFRAQGMTPEQARAAALKQAGNLIARREEIYQMNGIGWLDSLWSDFRYALRGLRHQPTFTATALLTLALGIGANTAIFGVIDSILIRPLPYPHAEALVGRVAHCARVPSASAKISVALPPCISRIANRIGRFSSSEYGVQWGKRDRNGRA